MAFRLHLLERVAVATEGALGNGRHGAERPTRVQWKSTAIIGAFLLVGGNGGVVWAERVVPSGLTAVLVAMVPLWMVLIGWVQRGRGRPGRWEGAGLALGFAGVFLLMSPGGAGNSGQ